MLDANSGSNASSLRFDWVDRNVGKDTVFCLSNIMDPTRPWPKPKKADVWMISSDGTVGDDGSDKMYYRDFDAYLNGKTRDRLSGSVLAGFEVVSPILTIKDIDVTTEKTQLDEAIRVLGVNGTFVYWNSMSTSNHIHISHHLFRDPASLFKMSLVFWYFEPVLMLMVAHWRRSNRWCNSMRDFLAGKHEVGSYFYMGDTNSRAAFSKYYERVFREADASTWKSMLKEVGLKADLPSVVHTFQNVHDRYSSLNLLNLSPKGTGTIEVRLKHGSCDAHENKMWMQLFLNIFHSAIAQKRWITASSDRFKRDAWDLYGHLSSNPDFKSKTRLKLNRETRTCLDSVLKEMKMYVPNKVVWEYWSKLLKKMHT